MARFVLLYHECPPGYERPSHWDLMLEAGDVLRTWAVGRLPRGWEAARGRTVELCAGCPEVAEGESVGAEKLADHRVAYLHEEGEVSGGRGRVTRIDRGTYASRERGVEMVVTLEGGLVRGRIGLRREADGKQWRLTVHHSSAIEPFQGT